MKCSARKEQNSFLKRSLDAHRGNGRDKAKDHALPPMFHDRRWKPRSMAFLLLCFLWRFPVPGATAQEVLERKPLDVSCPQPPADCILRPGESVTLPDAPERQGPVPATFWTFEGRDGHEAPIRSNREAFHDKTWLITQGVWLGTIMYDVEATHQGMAHHRCVEGNDGANHYPSRAELYRGSIAEYAAGTLWNYAMLRLLWKPEIFVFPAVSGVNHLVQGTKWFTDCW